jgi:hypothetical protein
MPCRSEGILAAKVAKMSRLDLVVGHILFLWGNEDAALARLVDKDSHLYQTG